MGTFSEWVAELGALHAQVNNIESQLKEIQNIMTQLLKDRAEDVTGLNPSGGVDDSTNIRDMFVSIRTLSRALYQYGMLARSFGLSPEINKQIREIQEMVMVIMNTMRALTMMYSIMAMMEAGTPLGWIGYAKLVGAGGGLAASVAYGIKLSSGR